MKLRLLALVATLLTPLSLLAGPTYTYTYTGLPFTFEDGGSFTSSESVTGSITLSAPLGDNLNIAEVTPTNFSFTDGVNTFTPVNATSPDNAFYFSTDASGDITSWTIAVFVSNGTQIGLDGPGLGSVDDVCSVSCSTSFGESSGAGSWTAPTPDVSATPEPSSLILLGTGVLGTIAAARRRLTTR